jgi:hypothetical protein
VKKDIKRLMKEISIFDKIDTKFPWKAAI